MVCVGVWVWVCVPQSSNVSHFMNKYSCKKICIVKEGKVIFCGDHVSPIQQALEAQVNTLSLQMEEANMQLVSST